MVLFMFEYFTAMPTWNWTQRKKKENVLLQKYVFFLFSYLSLKVSDLLTKANFKNYPDTSELSEMLVQKSSITEHADTARC